MELFEDTIPDLFQVGTLDSITQNLGLDLPSTDLLLSPYSSVPPDELLAHFSYTYSPSQESTLTASSTCENLQDPDPDSCTVSPNSPQSIDPPSNLTTTDSTLTAPSTSENFQDTGPDSSTVSPNSPKFIDSNNNLTTAASPIPVPTVKHSSSIRPDTPDPRHSWPQDLTKVPVCTLTPVPLLNLSLNPPKETTQHIQPLLRPKPLSVQSLLRPTSWPQPLIPIPLLDIPEIQKPQNFQREPSIKPVPLLQLQVSPSPSLVSRLSYKKQLLKKYTHSLRKPPQKQ